MSNYIFLAPKLAGDHNITTSSCPASCLMSHRPDSGFSQTAAKCQDPGERHLQSPVAAASGHMVEGGTGDL